MREQPLYLETDKFLNFLFHEERDHPAKAYKTKPHRVLADVERKNEIEKYRKQYRRAGFPGGNHSATAKAVQEHLAQPKFSQLTPDEVKMIAGELNCFGNRLALSRFLKGNDLDKIRKNWSHLVHGKDEVKLRMNNCHTALFGFGKAAIQETLGYYDPNQYPLRNENTNAGLRFLGYKVSVN